MPNDLDKICVVCKCTLRVHQAIDSACPKQRTIKGLGKIILSGEYMIQRKFKGDYTDYKPRNGHV